MRFLTGMKEICEYMRRSESTMLALIRDSDFPAKKIGGVWETHDEAIDDWRRRQIDGKSDNGGDGAIPIRKEESARQGSAQRE